MKKTNSAAILLAGLCLMSGCGKGAERSDAAPVKVKTEKVTLAPTDGIREYSGTVEESGGTSMSFMTAGTIKQIYVEQGQMVRRGALLAEVDETTLRNSYEMALAAKEQAEDAYARMKKLYDNKSLPEIQWIEVGSKLKQAVAAERIAKKSLADSKLYAPYSGFISAKTADVGQSVLPGVPVLKIVKIDDVKVKIAVPENEIAKVKKGGTMTVRVPALGGKVFSGVVTERDVTANQLSRSYDVKAVVRNISHELLPGMVCDVSLDNGVQRMAIVLPARIIQTDEQNHEFIWINDGGKASKRIIATDGQTASGVIVTGGLSGGEDLIVEGWQKVSEGMRVVR